MTFQQAMAATSRELNARATITCVDAFVISNTPVMSFSVEEGGQVTLGSVTSSRYTLSLPNGGGEWLKNGSILGNRSLTGARVQIQIGVYHDGAWDWQNAGLFIVEKTSAPEYGTAMKLIGNDPIISLDRAYDDQLAYRSTTTLGDILTHIKSKGVAITGSLACNASAIVNFQPDWGEEPTIRDALGYVLQMGGSLARCDRAGNITIAPANGSTTHAITTDKYTAFTDDERYFNFNRIKILPNGAKKDAAYVESYVTSAAESAANTLCLEGNPLFRTKTTTSYSSLSTAEQAAGLKNRKYYLKIGNKYVVDAEPSEVRMTLYYKANKSYNTATLQTMAAGLKTALTGMSFRAITFKWRGDPTVLIGDKVTLTDTRGVSVTTVILQQSLRYEGGFSSEISCPIDLTAVTPATLTSSGAWTPPYFGTGTIDGSVIMPESITGDLVVAGGITAEKIASKTVTADEIAAKTITADEIKAGTITADEVAAKTITADEIAAGTITATEIGASQITATHIGTNEIVANAANIKDGVITNAKIANGTIENAKIKDATIETAKIKDAAITTAKIQDAQITNAKIASAGIDFLKVKNSVLDTAIFREIVAGGDVYIDRLKVADANITNLTVGNLMVKRPDGTLHRIYVDGNGDLQTELVEVLYQNLSSDALLKVSEWTVYKKETAPTSPYVGQLWVKPSTGIMQKCLTITPSVTWGDVKAGELHTSYIDAVAKGLNILTGGELNVLGGSVNIKSLDGVANVINMDNTGMTISSTGKIDLQSTSNLNVQSGGNLNVLNGGDIEVNNGGDINVASGGKINVSATDLIISGKTVETYASDKIRLEVRPGGRNLVLDSRSIRVPETGYAGGDYVYETVATDLTPGEYSLSVEVGNRESAPGAVMTSYMSARMYSLSDGFSLLTKNFMGYTSVRQSHSFTIPDDGRSYSLLLYAGKVGATNGLTYTWKDVMLEVGNIPSGGWTPAPEDPASGVKTSSVVVDTTGIYMDTTGEISLNSGASMRIKSGTVQIEAGDATDSHLQFGDAFAVGKDAGGNYALSINSRSDDAIKINNKSIWHKGNIVVQQAQPPGGKQTVWLKPNATTSVMYQHTIVATNTSYYTTTTAMRSYALAAQSGDTMSAAGTYSFSVTMTFKRFGGTGLATYDTTGGTVQLKKGGQTLTLSALPSLSLKPWAERTVTVTGSTTSTAFTSATGDITCEVTVTGAKPYDNNDFLAHGRPSDVSCAITGPGGAAAQACQVFFVP